MFQERVCVPILCDGRVHCIRQNGGHARVQVLALECLLVRPAEKALLSTLNRMSAAAPEATSMTAQSQARVVWNVFIVR
jgi:hypothetical protein